MIYLKNNTETQSIYIPRQIVLGGGYIATIKTYEDGLAEGIERGKEIQKGQLLNLYVTENGEYEREDGWGAVTVDTPDCPELTEIAITENGRYEGAYNVVNVDVPTEGGSCNLGIGEYSFNTDDEGTYELYAENDGYDGWSKMFIHIDGGAIKVWRAANLLVNEYPDYGTKKYVGGEITEIQEVIQDCYKTYVLDNRLKIYKGSWFDGSCFNGYDEPIKVGDYVIVYGVLQDNNGELIIEEGSQVIAYQECEGGSGLNIGEAETTLGIGTKWTRTASQFGLDAMSKIVIDGKDTVYWHRAREMFKLAKNQTPKGYNGYAIGAENSVWIINGYAADIDTDVEIWVRPEEYNREWGGYFGSQSHDDAPDSFQIRKQSLQNTFLFQFGTEVCSYDFTPNTWYRLRMNRYGVWVNGEQIQSWDIQEYTSNGLPLAINGINNPELDDTTNLFRSNRATYGYIYFYNSSKLLAPCSNKTFAGSGLKGEIFRQGENPKIWTKEYYEGFSDGEGGSCNLEDKWVTPSMSDRDGNGLIVVNPSEGYNGLSRTVIDPQTIYNEGVEAGRTEGEASLAAKARVLNVTENGVYKSKFSDPIIPANYTVTGVYADGTEFYSYAELNGKVFNTNIPATTNSRIEFWYKGDNTLAGDAYNVIIGANYIDYSGVFEVIYYIFSNTEVSGRIGSTYFNTNWDENVWHHIILSKNDGFVVDGVKIGDMQSASFTPNSNFLINGNNYDSSRNANGCFGMIKIDNTIIIPTADGFQNVNTGELLEVVKDGTYTFTENLPIYAEGELYKTINVNVPTVQEQITDYYYCPITVTDSGFGDKAKSFMVKNENMYGENGWINDDSFVYLPTANNINEVRTKTLPSSVASFPFDDNAAQYTGALYMNVEQIQMNNVVLSNLYKLELGSGCHTLRMESSNLPNINTLIIRYNGQQLFDYHFSLTQFKNGGKLYVYEGLGNAENLRAALGSEWTIEYL